MLINTLEKIINSRDRGTHSFFVIFKEKKLVILMIFCYERKFISDKQNKTNRGSKVIYIQSSSGRKLQRKSRSTLTTRRQRVLAFLFEHEGYIQPRWISRSRWFIVRWWLWCWSSQRWLLDKMWGIWKIWLKWNDFSRKAISKECSNKEMASVSFWVVQW